MPENDDGLVHRTYDSLIMKEIHWIVSLRNTFQCFYIPGSFPYKTDQMTFTCYKVYLVEKLSAR